MLHRAIATLRDTLRPHLGLSVDRVGTLALIVVAMVSARTVNLSYLAAERPGANLIASTCRRLPHFFQYVRLGQDWAAPRATSPAPDGQSASPTDTSKNPGSEPGSTGSETSSDQTRPKPSPNGAASIKNTAKSRESCRVKKHHFSISVIFQ